MPEVIHTCRTGHRLQVERVIGLGTPGVAITIDVTVGDGRDVVCLTEDEMRALVKWWLKPVLEGAD